MNYSERHWPRIIGHRGAALLAPENTIAGFCVAAARDIDCVEFDVKLTRDGRCILLHDDTLDRTTNGQGPAASLTFEEIRRLDAGSWFGADYIGQPVPSLEEAVEVLGKLKLRAIVEIKPSPGAEAATGAAVAQCLAQRWPENLPPPLLSSFKPAALAAAREAAPQFERALLLGALGRDWQKQAETLGCSMIHADQRKLDAAAVAAMKAAGLPLFAYTVNLPTRARELFSWGVDAVFSDCPDRIVEVLAEPI